MQTKNEIISKAINTANFIQYSDGSVVSKQLIKKESGTITLFAFDKSQSLSEHTAPFDAFVQVVDGKGEFNIDGKPVIVSRMNSSYCLQTFRMQLMQLRNLKC